MKKKSYLRNANNYFWVEYWINEIEPKEEKYEIQVTRYDYYRWICEIDLPLINKTVRAISEKEINAVLNASNKAAKLIDEYMKKHRNLSIKNTYKRGGWIMEGNEKGEILLFGQSKVGAERENKRWHKTFRKARTILKKAIRDVSKICGTSKNLFIEVFDDSVFGKEVTSKEIRKTLYQIYDDNFNIDQTSSAYDRMKNKVIVIGFGNIKKAESKEDDFNAPII